jgi:type IV fimbrial biogenesis protein FimT
MRKRSSTTLLQVAMKSKGFTLIELMVTVGILAILLGLAAPSFVDALRRTQARNLGDDLMGALIFARQQAISTNQCVSVCMVDDASAGAPVCANRGGNWERGWLVYANPSCNSVITGADVEILQIHNGVANGPTIGVSNRTQPRLVQFNPRGQIPIDQAKQFNLAPRGGTAFSRICVAPTGRITRIAQTVLGNCAS